MTPAPAPSARLRWVVRWVQPDGEHGSLQFRIRDVLAVRRLVGTCRRGGDHVTVRLERVAPWRLGDL